MEKTKVILLLAALLVLLVGAVSASDVLNDTLGADAPESIATDTPAQEEVAVQKQATPEMDVQKNTVKSNENIREEKTLKTASSYDVTTYQELHDALTNLDDESITVNIKDNIKLNGTIMLEDIDVVSPIQVTINGEGKTIDGDHKHYFMNIHSPLLEVTINNLTISNCTGAPSLVDDSQLTAGGAIRNYATLTVNNTRFEGNNAELYGGAIWNHDTLIVDNSEFNNNTVHADNLGSNNGVGQGGAIYGGSVIINNTRFASNNAEGGGAIFIDYGNLTVDNTEFTGNHAENGGGAIYIGSTSTVTNTVFNNNTAEKLGGAINNGGTLIVDNTEFANNNAHGLYIEYDEIVGGYLMSGGYGGAISNAGTGNLTVNNTVFTGNHADNYGGAIDTTAYSNLTVTNTRFNNNHADWWGGAIYYINASEPSGLGEFHPHEIGSYNIADTTFYKNTPANFIINQDNYIDLEENANYINVSNIAVIVDGEEIYNGPLYIDGGNGPELIAYCEIPEGNHLVKLIVNGTNIINNEYILSDTIDVTYQGLIDVIEEATTDITIKLQDDVSYNILETITLDKPGITITIDGNGQTINGMQKQVFHINSGSSLVLNNITITNGQANKGGAIYNEGTLTIINSTLSNNNATWGGAIENSHGNLTITGSTLENNIAISTVEDTFEAYARGGAISNLYGNVTITNTTINNNQATATGGDVTANAYAGAISNLYGNVTITDSTINNNKATATATGNWDVTANAFGGVIYNTGTLIVTDSTLENNQATATATSTVDYITVKAHALGGAIYNTDTLTITESTIENNQATTTVSATGYDVTVDANTSGGVIYNYEDNYNITDTIFYKNSPANFIINETTKNIQLVNNDNYISIVNFTIIADGKEIGNGTCVENLTQFTILDEYKNVEIVINGTDEKTLNNRYMLRGYSTEVHNYTQLVKAIEKAQCENYDSYIINLLEGDYNATSNITWSNSATGNITINGNGLTLDGLDKYQFITIAAGHNLTIENITITNYTAIRGGAIQNNGTLTVDNTRFVNNHATDGGAICNVFGNLTVTNTLFADNHAGHRSGAIHNLGTLTITGTQFAGNNATSDGGAIYNIGNLTINNTTFTDNNANTSGGAINIGDGNLNVTGSIFQNNLGIIDGGAILIQDIDCTAVIEENTFIDNRANRYEVINVERGSPILENNTYSDTSECYGTITISTDGEVMIRNNVFYDGLIITKINITVNNTNPTINDKINLRFTLKDQLNKTIPIQNISVIINNETSILQTNQEGTASMDYTIKINETLVNATYLGNHMYLKASESIQITAEKLDTQLRIDEDSNTKVGKPCTITGILLDENDNPVQKAKVNITVNGTTTATTNELGQFNTTIILYEMGEYPITAVFYETDEYNPSTNNTAKVTATKTDTKLTLTVSNTTAVNSTSITITVKLTDIDNNPLDGQEVNITINDEKFTIKTSGNGIATKQYTTNKIGSQTVTANYYGNNMYNANSSTKGINVIKIDTQLTLQVSNKTPVNTTPINITATLTDTDGNKLTGENISITVGTKTYTLKTNNKGVVIQSYTPTKTETQTITATYKGDNKYVNSTATANITVKKINTKLSIKVSNTTPVNNTSINITATLTDTNGNKLAGQNVTITVSGKTYIVKTDKNGVATKAYTPTALGKQTITATYKGDSKYINSTATTNITVKKINTKITLQSSNTTPINNTPINITATLTDASGNKIAGQNIILNINGKNYTVKTDSNGSVTKVYTPTVVESQTITATYNGNSMYNNTTKSMKITVKNKIKTKTTVTPFTGVIGEKVTIKATVTDTNGAKVNEGNLIFKVNGVTIKDNGKLTGSSNPLKIKVVNGVATATLIPDINMTNAKNITASYIGTTFYNASISTPASINISKRNASIEVSINKKIIKQGQILTITAKIYDTTNGKKTTNITKYQDEYVYFKVNGITLKDADGSMLKVKIVNGTATVNYTITLGISCVTDMQTLTPKNHTIQVGLYNKNYQNIMTKTPTFQVERSNITINIANATVNNKTHKLSLNITIKDYLGNVVSGPNKCVIKVNGVTLKNGTNVQYYYTTDGVLILKNIPVPQAKNYTSIELITQDRLAYKSQRNITNVIRITS